jgi:hypothetical protein
VSPGARRFGDTMARFCDVVEEKLARELIDAKQPASRVATCDLLFAVRRRLRVPDEVLEYRLRCILTTAYAMGAFDGSPFVLRRGVGWTLAPGVETGKRAA